MSKIYDILCMLTARDIVKHFTYGTFHGFPESPVKNGVNDGIDCGADVV